MSRTFRDSIAEELEDVFLNDDEFGGLEAVTFTPVATGTPRTIYVYIRPPERTTNDQDETLEEMDRLEVMIWRDQARTNGGATDVYRGDKILRAAAQDTDQRTFAYTGELLYQDNLYRRLVFERPKRTTQGTT